MKKKFIFFALSFLAFEIGSWMLCQVIVMPAGTWTAMTWWQNVNGWHFCVVSGILAFVGFVLSIEEIGSFQ